MYCAVALIRSWPLRRAVCLAVISAGLAACSAESVRFGDNAYGPRNPQNESTGSVAPAAAAPATHVEARPLPHASAAPTTTPVAPAYVAGGGRGMASYNPDSDSRSATPAMSSYSAAPTPVAYNPPAAVTPPRPVANPEVTGSVAAPAHKPAAGGRWSWDGGTAVTVAPGETVDSIARRHGVPVTAVMQANNLASPNAIQAGQRLVIPRYTSASTGSTTVAVLPAHPAPSATKATPAPPPAAPAPNASPAGHSAAPASSEVHVVAAGDTLSKIARQYGKPLPELAKANNMQPNAKLNVGDRILIPGGRIIRAKNEGDQGTAIASKPEGREVAAVVTPAEAPNPVTSSKPNAEAAPGLRWPVHGRVIAAYGSKSNGQVNDGIDVAVPENTPVKAADDGVVAYAGNELKGYGNLVLVRHPSGYVTAYAHAKELLVKKGDPIKRGQVIAKSGQTGNVEVPQLHFEVRKGTTPIDPMQFLGGA